MATMHVAALRIVPAQPAILAHAKFAVEGTFAQWFSSLKSRVCELIIVIVFASLVFTAVISIGLGWLIASRSPSHFKSINILRAVILAGMVGAVSFVFFEIYNSIAPSVDAPQFSKRQIVGWNQSDRDLLIRSDCRPGPVSGTTVCESRPAIVTSFRELLVTFPVAVPVNKDFAVQIELQARNSALPEGIHSASLHVPKTLDARTTTECIRQPVEASGGVRACQELKGQAERLALAWIVTPTQTGTPIISIKSGVISAQEIASGSATLATISIGRDARPVTASESVVRVENATFDFGRNTVDFPVEVQTTVGVSQQTFDLAKALAGVVAGLGTLLGAGFALKFLPGRRGEEAQPLPAPGKPKSRRK